MSRFLPPALQTEYPFESNYLDLDGIRYHYLDAGQGPTLLFVHGNPTWSFAWRHLIRALQTEFRAIAVDHIGMGLSDKPPHYEYRLHKHVANLTRLIDHLDLEQITLIGHDWGGCIGMGAAVNRPARFQRFVMMNTAAFRSRRIPWRIAVCRIPWLGAVGVQGLNLFSRAALTMATSKPGGLTPIARQGYLFPYDRWEHRVAVHRFVQDIPLASSHPSYQTLVDIEQGLVQFQQHPWLLLWGERDWCFTPAFLEEWIERFPDATVVRYPHAGHYIFEDAGEQIAAQLRQFLLKSA